MPSRYVVDILVRGKDAASGPLKTAASSLSELGSAGTSGFAGLQRAVGVGLVGAVGAATAGLAGLGVGLGKAVSLGSDAEEMMGKFGVVFADTGDAVARSLDEFAASAGRSKFALRGMAAEFGDTLKPMGFAEEEAANLSVQLSELAVDLGSFNNMEADEALRRLQGTLIGSHENALAFGVVINENTLKAELAAQGWDKLSGAALEQAKVQARINLLMRGTTDAQGDAIRTAGGWANQTRRLTSILTDFGTEVGQKILPVITPLLARFTDLGVGVLPQLLVGFEQILGQIVSLAMALIEWDTATLPLLATLETLWGQVMAVVEPVASAVGSFVDWQDVLVALGVVVASIVIPALGSVVAAAAPVVAVAALLIAGSAALRRAWETNFWGVRDVTASVMAGLRGLVADALSAIQGWWRLHGDNVIAVVQAFTMAIQGIWSVWGDTLIAIARQMWTMIQTVIGSLLTIIASLIAAFAAAVAGDWETFGQSLQTAWAAYWEAIRVILATVAMALLRIIATLVSEIQAKFANVDWGGIGRSIIDGIKGGVLAAAGALAAAAANAARAALNAAKAALGIGSPSKEFAKLGQWTMEGFALGIGDAARMPVAATAGVMGDVALAATAPSGVRRQPATATHHHTWNVTIHAPGGEPQRVRRAAEQGVLRAARAMGLR